MHVVVPTRALRLGSRVKEQFDRRKVGLTEIVAIDDLPTAERTVHDLGPSVLLLVGARLDPVTLSACRSFGRAAEAQAPLIVMLEHATEEARIVALDAGADSVVQPFDPTLAEWRLRACRGRTNLNRAFHGKTLSFDDGGATVSVGGQRMSLTAREVGILRLLVHNRDSVVSRGELEQRIWGATRSRTLDVHVARLRQKLGPAGCFIHTVSKVGYRYVEPS